jgi:hypothetical protein
MLRMIIQYLRLCKVQKEILNQGNNLIKQEQHIVKRKNLKGIICSIGKV